MCSRFEVNVGPADLARQFDIDELPIGFTTGQVRPTDPALVIAADGPMVLKWGLNVDWDNKPLINARTETLAEKPTFRPLLQNRCIVPASAYFEWRRDSGSRLKNRIAPADESLMAFAGLHDGERFVVITCTPASEIAHIHNRMPVVLPNSRRTMWCDANRSYADVAPVLKPSASGTLAWIEDVPPPPDQPDLFSGLG